MTESGKEFEQARALERRALSTLEAHMRALPIDGWGARVDSVELAGSFPETVITVSGEHRAGRWCVSHDVWAPPWSDRMAPSLDIDELGRSLEAAVLEEA